MAALKKIQLKKAGNPDKSDYPLYRYYLKQLKDCLSLSEIIGKGDFEEEHIHRFRVKIKRIRSIYELAEKITKGKFIAERKSRIFEQPFKTAGKIREVQLNVELAAYYIKQNTCLTLFAKEQLKSVKKDKKTLTELLVEFDSKQLKEQGKQVKKIIKKAGDHTIIRESEKYIFSQMDDIESLLAKKYQAGRNKNFHRMRADLKKAATVLALLSRIDSRKMNKQLAVHIKKAENLAGKWHDLVVFTRVLSTFAEKNKKEIMKCSAVIEKAVDAVEKDKKQLLDEFRFMLRSAILGATLHSSS